MSKRSSSRRSSKQGTRARYTYVANRPTHTRSLGDSGNDATGTRVSVTFSWKVEVGIPDLHVKNFQQKKDRPPALKNLSHVSRSRDLFLFGLVDFFFSIKFIKRVKVRKLIISKYYLICRLVDGILRLTKTSIHKPGNTVIYDNLSHTKTWYIFAIPSPTSSTKKGKSNIALSLSLCLSLSLSLACSRLLSLSLSAALSLFLVLLPTLSYGS